MKPEFKKELETLINRHSIENEINMPDYMLAEMLCDYIESTGKHVLKRDRWLGYEKKPVEPSVD